MATTTDILNEWDNRDKLTKDALIEIKWALVTAKEEMLFRGSNENGQAMKGIENAIELSIKLINCYNKK